jgi:hypothetical protein
MKNLAFYIIITFCSFFAPIELVVITLMGFIAMDTLVKLLSLRTLARKENKPYREVFFSKILRRGYFYKSLGYLIIALPIFPLDFYFLTPWTTGIGKFLGYAFTLPTKAVYTNLLLIIFCLMELSSINENWFDFSGNNLFRSIYSIVGKIRKVVAGASAFYKDIKKD